MKVTAAQLAQLLEGSIEGDPTVKVSRPARIEEAREGDLAFLDNPRYEHYAYSTEASVLLVHSSFSPSQKVKATLIRVQDVRNSLAILLQQFQEGQKTEARIAENASIHPEAQIGAGSSIGEFAVIQAGVFIGENTNIHPQVFVGANVRIGNNCVLFPGVRIHHDCVIGDNCVLHSNAVVGTDGFGYAPQDDRSWKKVPQVGNVVLEDDVEIGANTCIDRAALGSTIIHKGAKLDNLIHVAHNVEIGQNTVMAAQVGIAGSTKIGDNCQLGGQTGVSGHITVANGTRVQAQSGLSSSVKKPNKALFGSPAINYNEYVRAYVVFKQLPELQRKLRALELKIKDLEG